jgi:hypothetical protein
MAEGAKNVSHDAKNIAEEGKNSNVAIFGNQLWSASVPCRPIVDISAHGDGYVRLFNFI